MKSVQIAELKNRLSLYLKEVREGGEIIVRDRQCAIARIVPLVSTDDAETELQRLAAAGKVRLGTGALDESFWALSAPRILVADIRRVMDEERDEG